MSSAAPRTPTRHRLYVGKDATKFSVAHMTYFPDGTKERLHGHNYQVSIALDLTDVSFRHFIPFGDIKEAFAAQCHAWDEHLLVAEKCPGVAIVRHDARELEFTMCGQRYVVPSGDAILLPIENVVCETLAVEFGRQLMARLAPKLAQGVVAGVEIDVSESAGQGATYYWTWSS